MAETNTIQNTKDVSLESYSPIVEPVEIGDTSSHIPFGEFKIDVDAAQAKKSVELPPRKRLPVIAYSTAQVWAGTN